jgi:uncharacterized small protein (DUF1192 family)
MDTDDLEPIRQNSKPFDLSMMSIEDLEEYIDNLKTEIVRVEAAIKKKTSARAGAEAVFKS